MPGKTDIKNGTHQSRKPGYPGERLSIDLIGPLPVTNKMNKYILSCEDEFTRFVTAHPLPNKEATTVAAVLLDKHLSIFGMPECIRSDNGKEFSSKVMDHLCDRLNIRKTNTPAYNPQSNSVE